jgi:CHAT domain-containing protein/tetratricopeptide (TPR) repeat protein
MQWGKAESITSFFGNFSICTDEKKKKPQRHKDHKGGLEILMKVRTPLIILLVVLLAPIAGAQENDRDAARRVYLEAEQLRQKVDPESRKKALEKYGEALQLSRKLEDRLTEALTLSNRGFLYGLMGDRERAIRDNEQALPLWREIGDHNREALSLYHIAQYYSFLNDSIKAIDYFNQALELYRKLGDRKGEGDALYSIGGVYNILGERQKALDYRKKALPHFRAAGYRKGEGFSLMAIGTVYLLLGDAQNALDYFNRTLALSRENGDRQQEANATMNIGKAYAFLGDLQTALNYYNKAMALRNESQQSGSGPTGEAGLLSDIGMVYHSLGDDQRALDYLKQSISLWRIGRSRSGEEIALTNIAEVYSSLGEKQEALNYFKQALSIQQAIGEPTGEARSLFGIAKIEHENNLKEALSHIERALSIVESLRSNVIIQELRATYFASVQDYYKLYIDILMRLHSIEREAGHDSAALRASERARARSLLDLLSETRVDFRQDIASELIVRERELRQRLNSRAENLFRLKASGRGDTDTVKLEKELTEIASELRELQAEIRQKSPRYAALTQPQTLTLKEIQQLLDADTALLEYSLGEERSFLWVVTPDSMSSYQLPERRSFESIAKEVYSLLLARQPEPGESYDEYVRRAAKADKLYWQTAAKLSSIALGPIAAGLLKKRLLIVADGVLQYIPFSALPLPAVKKRAVAIRRPLLLDYEIINLPSASSLAALRRELSDRKPAPGMVAVLADPVFDGEDIRVKRSLAASPPKASEQTAEMDSDREPLLRSALETGVSDGKQMLGRLPFSRQEAEVIASLIPPGLRKQALDFEASRATAMSDELGRYRFVHFATHGLINSLHPELSGLVFSMVDETGKPQNGFLRLHEIYNLKLPADLVVLSACQTALGKEVRGEGIVGLTRGFMYAGASRVMASLWKIDDVATAELMNYFYKGILGERRLSAAAALREAQIHMYRRPRWRQPFFWAAFLLQGEWR